MEDHSAIDASLCNGCYGCQMACKDEHCGNDWRPIRRRAARRPASSGARSTEKTRGKVPEVKVHVHARCMCGHCEDAACLNAAKDGAVYRREDGLHHHRPGEVQGPAARSSTRARRGRVLERGARRSRRSARAARTCSTTAGRCPRCVDVCANEALTYVDEEDVPEGATPMPVAEGAHPHVCYINIPKRWVYGVLVDRTINEVIIGAEVKLHSADGEVVATLSTDEFGEFRFKDVKPASYVVKFEQDGYLAGETAADANEVDVNVGSIALYTA